MAILALDTVYAIDELMQHIEIASAQIELASAQIELLQSIDWGKPVNENTWHQLCITPMRGRKAMELMASAIFPKGENFSTHKDGIHFELHGFRCVLPTTQVYAIYVDLQKLHQKAPTQTEEEWHEEIELFKNEVFPNLLRFSPNVRERHSGKSVEKLLMK